MKLMQIMKLTGKEVQEWNDDERETRRMEGREMKIKRRKKGKHQMWSD